VTVDCLPNPSGIPHACCVCSCITRVEASQLELRMSDLATTHAVCGCCCPCHCWCHHQDGTSNWLKGAMLVLTYLFIAAGFWVHKDPSLQANQKL
jgi:Ca2+/H+ antiporter